MKKFLLLASTALALLSAASCQKERPFGSKGEVKVSFTVALPEVMTTKAIADAYNVDVVYYEVWNADWSKQLYPVNESELAFEEVNGRKANVELVLVADQTYNFIFWAQNKDCGAYTVNDLQKIKIDYDVIARPQDDNDNFDAFYAVEPIKVTGTHKTVYLNRALAQLNIGASRMKTDFGDIKVGKSTVSVYNLATVFNTRRGMGEEPLRKLVEFHASGLASNEEKLEANEQEYTWVTMDYMCMLDDKSNADVELEIEVNGIGTVKHKVPSVPLHRNHRTNIVGDLFTTEASLAIEIKPAFETPDYIRP